MEQSLAVNIGSANVCFDEKNRLIFAEIKKSLVLRQFFDLAQNSFGLIRINVKSVLEVKLLFMPPPV